MSLHVGREAALEAWKVSTMKRTAVGILFLFATICLHSQSNEESTGPDVLKDSPLVRQSFHDSALEAVDLTDDAVWLLDYPQNLLIPVFIRAKEAANALLRKESTKGEAELTGIVLAYQFDLDLCLAVKRCSADQLKIEKRKAIKTIKSALILADPPAASCAAPALSENAPNTTKVKRPSPTH